MQFVQFSIENFSKTIDEDNGPKCHLNILELLFATKSCNNNYTDFITGVSEVNMCSSSIVYNTTIYTATLSTEHVFSSPTTSFKVVSKYPKWTTYVCSDGDAFHITVSILQPHLVTGQGYFRDHQILTLHLLHMQQDLMLDA